MKKDEVELFIKVQSQMEEMYKEISLLSKKSQDDALNEFKLQFVNKLLEECNTLLGEKNKPFADFNAFDLDKIPTNSDVVMVLSQYLASLESMRILNIQGSLGDWYWKIDNKASNIKTGRPKRLS
jgi:hypothetical protein